MTKNDLKNILEDNACAVINAKRERLARRKFVILRIWRIKLLMRKFHQMTKFLG